MTPAKKHGASRRAGSSAVKKTRKSSRLGIRDLHRRLQSPKLGQKKDMVVRWDATFALLEQVQGIVEHLVVHARTHAKKSRHSYTVMIEDVEAAYRAFIDPRQLGADIAGDLTRLADRVRERAAAAAAEFKEE